MSCLLDSYHTLLWLGGALHNDILIFSIGLLKKLLYTRMNN